MAGRRGGRGILWMALAAGLAWSGPAAGAQWDRVGAVAAGPVTALAADATGARVAAAAGETIFVSENGGALWRAGERMEGEATDLLFLGSGPLAGHLIVSGPSGVRVSRDGHAWQMLDRTGGGGRGVVRALAEDPRDAGAIALGTESGVLLVEPRGNGRPPVAALPGRSVDRLAWDDSGALHAASPDGLYRIEGEARVARREVARPTAWVASSGAVTLAVTDRGYVVARDAGGYRDLPGTREMAFLAARFAPEPGSSDAFLAAAPGRLFRVRPDQGIEPLGDGPPGETILALLPLPGGRVLAGTDRGLFETSLAATTRVTAPEDPARQVASWPGEIDLLWRAEPGIEDVRRAVLRANQLAPGRMVRNFHGARWRALFPALSISAHRQLTRGLDRNADETFSSNAVHRLFDAGSDSERRREVVAAAEWDLGALLFNPDELDVSEESRRLVTLRDDVLDEVNQIYFERRRAILALLRAGGPDSGKREEAIELRIRIDELTAKLDAWTDGYFSREIARRVSSR